MHAQRFPAAEQEIPGPGPNPPEGRSSRPRTSRQVPAIASLPALTRSLRRSRPAAVGTVAASLVGMLLVVAGPSGAPGATETAERAPRRERTPVTSPRPDDVRELLAAASTRPATAAAATATIEPAHRAAQATVPTPSAPSAPPPRPEPVVNRPPPGPDRVAPDAEQDTPPPPAPESTAVHPDNFPDPYVVHAHGFYWAFATQSGLTKVPTMRSSDLVRWTWVGDALQQLPSWAEWGHNWAPSVLQRGTTFVLYYTTRHRDTGLQCISRAVAALPQGPYVDESAGPLICQTERGGSIDPSPFVDVDGRAWLLWKSEGTLHGEPTRIWVRPLSPDGLQLAGAPTQLLERALDWELPIVEGPSMTFAEGRYHLLYSGNRWQTAQYAVGHAVCASVTGPCRRTSAGPVLASRPGEAGPGGQELTTAPDGSLVLVHHAWEPSAVGYPSRGVRRLHVSAIRFVGDRVEVGGPWGDRGTRGIVDAIGG